MSALLSVDDVTVRFGGVVALDGVSFDVERGHIVGLIGPNGAGKTTLFNCLSRLCTPDRGSSGRGTGCHSIVEREFVPHEVLRAIARHGARHRSTSATRFRATRRGSC